MVKQSVINIVKEYLTELSAKGIVVSKAYVYGSQARGTASEESDIDLMLVSPMFDEDTDKFMPAIWISETRINYKIEPIAVGEKRFMEDDVSPIIEIVRQEGIEIAA